MASSTPSATNCLIAGSPNGVSTGCRNRRQALAPAKPTPWISTASLQEGIRLASLILTVESELPVRGELRLRDLPRAIGRGGGVVTAQEMRDRAVLRARWPPAAKGMHPIRNQIRGCVALVPPAADRRRCHGQQAGSGVRIVKRLLECCPIRPAHLARFDPGIDASRVALDEIDRGDAPGALQQEIQVSSGAIARASG